MAQAPQPTRPDWPALYRSHHAALTTRQVDEFFERGQQWQLAPTLSAGGVVVFPHAAVMDCGHQVATAVLAALASGASKILVVSVLHAWTPEMQEARNRLAAGEDLSQNPLRGIQGPVIANSRQEWRLDHALISWRYFWNAACERRRLNAKNRPQVQEVYPFLAGDQPQTLLHFDEVARWAEDAVIVSTADPFHHGIGYGDDHTTARAPEAGGLDLARASIEISNQLLAAANFAGYLEHCVRARNDARDAGPIFRTLNGPIHPQILDIVASDMAEIYGAPAPTWVAGALTAWQPLQST